MKTDFLKELGIEDQNVIDKIMAQNGKDIENAKKNLTELETKVENLESQIKERDTQLKELKKSAEDNEALTAKIAELEEKNKTTTAEYEAKLETMRNDHTVESKLRDAKVRNVKAAKALLNLEEDIDEQIKTLQENEETSFLFETKQEPPAPSGTNPAGGKEPPATPHPKTFRDAVAQALNLND